MKEACGREGFSGRGSALLEVFDINGKAFSATREWLSFYFPSWWDKDWKIMSKKHVTGIFPGKKS